MEQHPQTALFPICQYIKGNGSRCGSPALSGARFCYHHFGGSVSALKRAHSQAASQSGKLKFVDPTSREAIQHNLFVIAQGINDGKLDLMVANAYHRLFRTCEINLSRWEKANKDNPEKQMASPNTVTPADNLVIPTEAGAPTDRSSSVGWGASVASEAEELVLSETKASALHDDSSTPTLHFAIPADPNAMYNSEGAQRVFREIDKRYMHSPDYGLRTSDALDALLRGGPVHEWLHEILKSTGFSPPMKPLENNGAMLDGDTRQVQ